MNRNRCALACALALASSGALAQSSSATSTVVADTLIQLYGHLDLSIYDVSKGISGKTQGGVPATGRLGWQPDISSNLSYIGVRGSRDLTSGLRGVFQVETQIDVAATPGPSTVPDNSVKGAFASRNSFLGIAGGWGAFKVGKS